MTPKGTVPVTPASSPPPGAMEFVPTSASRADRFRLELPRSTSDPGEARPLLFVLGLPTFGLAFAITILTTYGPSVLTSLGLSAARVGALIGGEGAFALVVPLLSGALSDRMTTASGVARRMPFVLVGAPLTGAGLVLLPFAPDFHFAGLSILIFFVGYYVYYPPYRAIFADLLPRTLLARAQSVQAIQRGIGLGVALVAGGLLISLWQPLPFVVGAGALGLTTLALKPVLRLQDEAEPEPVVSPEPAVPATSARELILHNRGMQMFAVANSLWEFSLAGLKIFIVLYVVRGLGRSSALASAVIATVAVAYVVGAPLASRLAERFGIVQAMTWAAAMYGVALCCGVVPTTVTPMLILLPIGAIAGAVLMTLPQALAFNLAPHDAQGAAAGLVDFSRGVGVVLGPVLVGAAVTASNHGFLADTHGYAIMWPAIGLPVLVSVPLLRWFARHSLGEPTRQLAEG
ncbi:MAG TPA: MFS transporter [Mycobacteriales bacterium]|nr:MFS transporter [Mycobacteriales bacterium]